MTKEGILNKKIVMVREGGEREAEKKVKRERTYGKTKIENIIGFFNPNGEGSHFGGFQKEALY